jgi:hypothetical protein
MFVACHSVHRLIVAQTADANKQQCAKHGANHVSSAARTLVSKLAVVSSDGYSEQLSAQLPAG